MSIVLLLIKNCTFYSAIAHVLAKIDMNEDREMLQNQYKDISDELQLKTDALRRYRHRVNNFLNL